MKKKAAKMTAKRRDFGQILEINIISTSTRRVLAGIRQKLAYNLKFFIVTPNSELVLMAQNNPSLKKALNASEFPVPDGIGLNYASRFLSGKSLNIIPGRKLFGELIRLADKNKWKVFFLGGQNNEAKLAAEKLKILYSGFEIRFFAGPKLDRNANPLTEIDKKIEKEAIDKINKFAPDLLFVAFGNPKQEIWVHKNLPRLKIGGAMCVGGTFRYVAGLSKLPPKWMEKAGLEWLWRLAAEPRRFGRIINAVIVFPWKVFLSRIGLFAYLFIFSLCYNSFLYVWGTTGIERTG